MPPDPKSWYSLVWSLRHFWNFFCMVLCTCSEHSSCADADPKINSRRNPNFFIVSIFLLTGTNFLSLSCFCSAEPSWSKKRAVIINDSFSSSFVVCETRKITFFFGEYFLPSGCDLLILFSVSLCKCFRFVALNGSDHFIWSLLHAGHKNDFFAFTGQICFVCPQTENPRCLLSVVSCPLLISSVEKIFFFSWIFSSILLSLVRPDTHSQICWENRQKSVELFNHTTFLVGFDKCLSLHSDMTDRTWQTEGSSLFYNSGKNMPFSSRNFLAKNKKKLKNILPNLQINEENLNIHGTS